MLWERKRRGGDPFRKGGVEMCDLQPVLHRVPGYEPPVRRPCARAGAPPGGDRVGAEDPAAEYRPRAAASGAAVPPPASPGEVVAEPVRGRSATVLDSGPASAPTPPRTAEVPATHPESRARSCASRSDRNALRRNHSAPAGVRRAQRAGHATSRNTEPAGVRAFATTSVRILLEVLDRRRPVAQLTALCTPGLVSAIGTLVAGDHAPGRTLGSAVPGTVRLFQVEEWAAEMVATYQRGPRRLVLAGRIERGSNTPWKVTALRVL